MWKQLKVEDVFVLIVVNVTNKCVVEKKRQELRLNSVPKGIFSGSLDEQCDQKIMPCLVTCSEMVMQM